MIRDRLDNSVVLAIETLEEALVSKAITADKKAKIACDLLNWRFRVDAEQRKIELHKEDLIFKRTTNLMKDYDLSEKEEAYNDSGDKTTTTNPSFSPKVVG